MARSANVLMNKRSGRAGNYGLVLENLLAAKGQQFHPIGKSGASANSKDGIAGTLSPNGGNGAGGANGAHNSSIMAPSTTSGSIVAPAPAQSNGSAGVLNPTSGPARATTVTYAHSHSGTPMSPDKSRTPLSRSASPTIG